jgi:hypothetical protein
MLAVNEIARIFLAGRDVQAAVVAALRAKSEPRWVRRLNQAFRERFPVRPRHRDVVDFLLSDVGFRKAMKRAAVPLFAPRDPQTMQPAGSWQAPALTTVNELASWLELTEEELDWFADLKATGTARPLHHYRYRIVKKRAGRVRVIESPKPRLKALQRRILSEIVESVPAHPAAHGFVRGRSAVTFATPHIGQRVALRLDLRDFFPSISGVRVQALFRVFGYPEAVADLLGGICTNRTPFDELHECAFETRQLYGHPHLPQGAPTSPALANRIAYRLDCRLSGLAEAAGARYTRYADDLAFSGREDFTRAAEGFAAHVSAIAAEEGLVVNFRKTRLMRQGVRQHLAGIVTNTKLNVPREDFDGLKAILTNCVRHGAESQNRTGHPRFREHLTGRVAWVESVNPDKGARLREILHRIVWGN